MACNAWNHSANCNCGWGGDTGGGYRGTAAQARSVSDGFLWQFERGPKYETFVNPNARCPVCGASVYFYQSPPGGRVFFDELGPPWPKHACTDTWLDRGGQSPIQPPLFFSTGVDPRKQNPNDWQPLIPLRVDRDEKEDRLFLYQQVAGLLGDFVCLPANTFGVAPAFCRRNPAVPGEIEVSIPSVDAVGTISEVRRSVPAWFCDDSDVETFEAGQPISADTLNTIGWSYSFYWKDGQNLNWVEQPGVDFELAREFFERAADLGSSAAQNNLGVMCRDGHGVAADAARALEYFKLAAQALEPSSLRHLACCYREGAGTDVNIEEAHFLEELAEIEDETRHEKLAAFMLEITSQWNAQLREDGSNNGSGPSVTTAASSYRRPSRAL